jgi:hypothetical protein
MECNASFFNETLSFGTPITVIRIIGSLLSIGGTVSIIIAVFVSGKLKNPEIHPLFTLSIADFILSFTWLIGSCLWLHEINDFNVHSDILGLCYVLGITTTITSIVTALLTLLYAVYALCMMVYIAKYRGRVTLPDMSLAIHVLVVILYAACWILPPILVLSVTESEVGLHQVANKNICWCYIDFFNLRPDNADATSNEFDLLASIIASFTGSTFIVISTTIIVVYIVTVIIAWRLLIQREDSLIEVNSSSRKTIRRLIIRPVLFISVYIICNFPLLIAAGLVWREDDSLSLVEDKDKFVLLLQVSILVDNVRA